MCEIDNDGGYYAIKGFLYQFDKTIIEILDNPSKNIEIENIQDINYEKYVIQVKHRESSNFSNSKIKKPIIQLLEIFKKDEEQKFCLYCHFTNKTPNRYVISDISELNRILKYEEQKKNDDLNLKFSSDLRKKFIKNFTIVYSDNYIKQFDEVINKIKSKFNISESDKVYIFHSIIKSKLLDLVIKVKEKNERKITFRELESYINHSVKTIFYSEYEMYLGKEKYLNYIKKEYFTFKSPNVDNFERLFIIDCSDDFDLTDLRKIVNNIQSKYYKENKSPAPYICFKNIKYNDYIELKVGLINDCIFFCDGTCFNGDKFKIDRLVSDEKCGNKVCIKLLNEDNIDEVLNTIEVKEIYNLFLEDCVKRESLYKIIKIQIKSTKDVLKIIK